MAIDDEKINQKPVHPLPQKCRGSKALVLQSKARHWRKSTSQSDFPSPICSSSFIADSTQLTWSKTNLFMELHLKGVSNRMSHPCNKSVLWYATYELELCGVRDLLSKCPVRTDGKYCCFSLDRHSVETGYLAHGDHTHDWSRVHTSSMLSHFHKTP